MKIKSETTGCEIEEFHASTARTRTLDSPTVQAVVATAIKSAAQWHTQPDIAIHFTATEESVGSYGQALDYFESIAADTLYAQGIPFDRDQLTWMIQRHFICG